MSSYVDDHERLVCGTMDFTSFFLNLGQKTLESVH